jgi:hypothetical protein
VNYDLALTKPGYSNLAVQGVVASPSPGSVVYLGDCWMSPLDTDANGLPDVWETLYFGGGAAVLPLGDQDGDGMNNQSEYLAGTDPTNSLSVLQIVELIKSPAAGFQMNWNGVGGRNYRVQWSDAPGSWPTGQCVLVGATNAWSDTTQPRPHARFYRVGVELP